MYTKYSGFKGNIIADKLAKLKAKERYISPESMAGVRLGMNIDNSGKSLKDVPTQRLQASKFDANAAKPSSI